MWVKRKLEGISKATLFLVTTAVAVFACDAGGYPASQCSVSVTGGGGCSVSCAANSYACCNYYGPVCTCVAYGS
jgi:hypothetical protein